MFEADWWDNDFVLSNMTEYEIAKLDSVCDMLVFQPYDLLDIVESAGYNDRPVTLFEELLSQLTLAYIMLVDSGEEVSPQQIYSMLFTIEDWACAPIQVMRSALKDALLRHDEDIPV